MTLTPYSSTPEDTVELLRNMIKSRIPDANVEEGYPLYELLIKPFADIVYSERETSDILRQVNSVLPLFDDQGNLKYPAYEDALRARYFIAANTLTDDLQFLWLRFDKKTDFAINRGSIVRLGDTVITLHAYAASAHDNEWEVIHNLFSHKVPIESVQGKAAVSGSNFDISGISYSADSPIISAYTVNAIAPDTAAPLSLDVIQNSISNRSFSNARALRYHFAVDPQFYPTDLRQTRILKANDREFIEGYHDLVKTYNDKIVHLQVRTGGEAKILFDYGYSNLQTKGTFTLIEEGEVIPFELPWYTNRKLYKIHIPNSAGMLYPSIFYSAIDDGKDFSQVISSSFTQYENTPHIFSNDKVYDSVEKRSYTTRDPLLKLGLTATSSYTTSDILESGYYLNGDADFQNLISYFEITDPNNNYNQTAKYSVQLAFNATNTAVIVSLYTYQTPTSPPTLYATGNLTTTTASQLNNIKIPLVTFTDIEVGAITLTGITPTNPSSGVKTTLETTLDNTIIAGSRVLGFANNTIYVEVATTDAAATITTHAVDGHIVYIGYTGTDVEKLQSSLLFLANKENAEIPTTIYGGAYRPVAISIDFNDKYIYPLSSPTTSEEADRFKTLIEMLDAYFNNRIGPISTFSIKEIFDKFSSETGFFIRRVDYQILSQNGIVIDSGYLSGDSEDTHMFALNIKTNVQQLGYSTAIQNEEDLIFYPDMYKIIVVRRRLQ